MNQARGDGMVRRRHRGLLGGLDDDPLSAVANLFDVAMVFAVALILTMLTALSVPGLLTRTEDLTIVRNAGKPDMEIIMRKGVKIDRYRMSRDVAAGSGRRLGVAYMLPNGEVIYVPEETGYKDPAGNHAADQGPSSP